MFSIPSTGFSSSICSHSSPSLIHLMSDLRRKGTWCLYLCVKAAPILCSACTQRVHGQREEGPSPQQPEVTAPLGRGHDGGLGGSLCARASLAGGDVPVTPSRHSVQSRIKTSLGEKTATVFNKSVV